MYLEMIYHVLGCTLLHVYTPYIGSMAKFFNLCGSVIVHTKSLNAQARKSIVILTKRITNRIRTKKSEYFTSAIEENKTNSSTL